MRFDYAAEKFSQARRILMVPQPRGEAEAVHLALAECNRGLCHLDEADLDDQARMWVARLRNLMGTARGAEAIAERASPSAVRVSVEDMGELARIVDELTYWFERKASV